MPNAIIFVGSNNSQSSTLNMLRNAFQKASKIILDLDYEIISSKDVFVLQCIGCGRCFLYGQCPLDLKDDMLLIKEKLQQADIIVFSSPVYANNVSGSMKVLIDRLSYWNHTFELSNKKALAIATSSVDGYAVVLSYLDGILSSMGCFTFPAKYFLRGYDSELYEDSVARDIIKMVQYNKDLTNDRLEKMFVARKNHYEQLYRKGISSYETTYWCDHGYLKCDTYLDLIKKKGGKN